MVAAPLRPWPPLPASLSPCARHGHAAAVVRATNAHGCACAAAKPTRLRPLGLWGPCRCGTLIACAGGARGQGGAGALVREGRWWRCGGGACCVVCAGLARSHYTYRLHTGGLVRRCTAGEEHSVAQRGGLSWPGSLENDPCVACTYTRRKPLGGRSREVEPGAAALCDWQLWL